MSDIRYNKMLLEMLEDGPHHMSPFMLLIYGMAREKASQRPDFLAVELGTSHGNSTVSIASGLACVGVGHLHTCDINEPSTLATEAIYRAGASSFCSFHQCDSVEFSKRFADNSVDLLFHDTSHESVATVLEIEAWAPKVRPGGRWLFHDTLSRPEGVTEPIRKFLENHPWPYYNIDLDCGLGVLIKPI